MIDANFITSGIHSIVDQANTSSNSDGHQIDGDQTVNVDGAKVEQDLVNYGANKTPSGMLAIYNDLNAYKTALAADGATSQTINGVDNYVNELITLLGNSGMPSSAPSAVTGIISFIESTGLQSNGVALGADGAVTFAGSALAAAMSAFASSSGSLTSEQAVLEKLNQMTAAMAKDGASSATISMIVSTVEGYL